MNIVLLGAPGSGKGTCCKFISQKYGLSHIAMGDIFRKNIEDNTKIGKEAEKYINSLKREIQKKMSETFPRSISWHAAPPIMSVS